MPVYFTKGQNQDRVWKQEGLCRGAASDPTNAFYQAWYAEERKVHVMPDGTRIRGAEMVAVALNTCGMCPAQWDCASWALRVDEDYGTWGMKIGDLKWLKTQPDALDIIEAARAAGEIVQAAVGRARALAGTVAS